MAENVSRVIQLVWQVQQGCRSHCYGTSQWQRSAQWSETTQSATAVGGGSAGDGGVGAEARNESSTIQFVWQMQIGCVAFCFETSQTQEASQYAYTSQEAIAQSALTTWAENLAETVQYVFQIQEGCAHECHGTSQSQSVTQSQSTSQSASAGSGPSLGDDGSVLVPDWLIAYARNTGATIQTIYQYQEALCLEQCEGEAQVQDAAQRAETDQRAVALAPPSAGDEPPLGEPPAEQPPASAPAPEGGAPAAIPAGASAGPAPAATPPTGSRRRHRVLAWGRTRGRTRRQELVLGAALPGLGGGATTPAAPDPGAEAGTRATAGPTQTVRTASFDRKPAAAGIQDEQQPASTFSAPPAPTPGGSIGWLTIALIAALLAGLIASLRRVLAWNMTRI